MRIEELRPTHIEIDLSAIRHNVRQLRALLAPETRFMAVVKADAYGHGLYPASCAALEAGASMLGVAIAEEGALLRARGVRAPILVLGATLEEGCENVVRNRLTQTVFSIEQLKPLIRCAKAFRETVDVHIKIDTGMGRIGARNGAELNALLACINASPELRLTGVYTHLASADEAAEDARAYTRRQLDAFARLTASLPANILRHAANSAGTLDWPEARLDMVRCGIALYGVAPSPEVRQKLDLRPALSWQTRVVHIKMLPAGECVSYGRSYTTRRDTRVATLPVGYGDGYHRSCGNRAQVLVCGKRAPVIGRVCMDQLMIDVTGIEGVQVGERATLLGRQGEEAIGAQELAEWANTIPYEVLLGALPRVPRIYSGEANI